MGFNELYEYHGGLICVVFKLVECFWNTLHPLPNGLNHRISCAVDGFRQHKHPKRQEPSLEINKVGSATNLILNMIVYIYFYIWENTNTCILIFDGRRISVL